MLAEHGRAADIGEQNCNVEFRAAGRKAFASRGADARIFSRRVETRQPDDFAADPAERVEADFASWRTRQMAKDPVRPGHPWMTFDKNPMPSFFRRRFRLRGHLLRPPAPQSAEPSALHAQKKGSFPTLR